MEGLESIGMGYEKLMEIKKRMKREIMGNKDMMRKILENNLVKRMMNDNENMRNIIK